MASRRSIWTSLFEATQFRIGRLYDTFYNAQYNNKYALVLLFPTLMCLVRWRIETKLGYHLFITDERIIPDYSKDSLLGSRWQNGQKIYLGDNTLVSELKEKIYKDGVPKNVRVGCRGRMMNDSDNLAMAVKAFCRRDPNLVLWSDEL